MIPKYKGEQVRGIPVRGLRVPLDHVLLQPNCKDNYFALAILQGLELNTTTSEKSVETAPGNYPANRLSGVIGRLALPDRLSQYLDNDKNAKPTIIYREEAPSAREAITLSLASGNSPLGALPDKTLNRELVALDTFIQRTSHAS
jgi:hypothetical protein